MKNTVTEVFVKALKQLLIACFKMLMIIIVWIIKFLGLVTTKIAETLERIILKNT